MSAVIDLNADVGEGAGSDAALMPFLTSANLACGAHAGDEATFRSTLEGALRHGVAIGAHPGFADRAHFGRRELALAPAEAAELVEAQIRWAQRLAAEQGARLRHVKLHGALYHLAARDGTLARALAAAVRRIDPKLIFVGLAGSELTRAGAEVGLRVAGEAFADRTYRSDGSLTPRSEPGALIADEAAALAQVLGLVREGRVIARDGAAVHFRADTICLHGDGPRAVSWGRSLRAGLAEAGVVVRPLGDWLAGRHGSG
jgi:UPF0271 protein